jgi:hypothetical protein
VAQRKPSVLALPSAAGGQAAQFNVGTVPADATDTGSKHANTDMKNFTAGFLHQSGRSADGAEGRTFVK